MTPLGAAIAGAAILAIVHVVTPWLRFLGGTPRSIWLSIAGGVSVAYVFVHLLPELAEGQQSLSRAVEGLHRGASPGLFGAVRDFVLGLGFAERHVYLIALAGLAVFYGLDKLAKRSRARTHDSEALPREGHPQEEPGTSDVPTSRAVFWIHMVSFGLYNALIGYLLLHREVPGLVSLAFFVVAMALHFLVTDFALNEDHRHRYRTIGRWFLVVALALGVWVGASAQLSKATIAVLVAFLAGGVILNVLKEEVPGERRSRFWAFGAGMAVYAALLLTF